MEVIMSTRIFSSRDFTRDVAAAKAAALAGPVLITDRGHPAFVMLNIDEYRRLQGKAPSLFALMQQLPELPDDVLEIPRMDIEFRDVDF
jgi:PHD/YefM family antitoxin component YafN of YafNO toxin-antitoxin module